ncbi:MAG: ABC transporter permease [Acidobacteria bacterium]|nr:ABC transporter permease [Acidobacteriota bacterium]
MALMLLIGAGLLVKSFLRLRAVAPGFDPKNVLSMAISFSPARYPQPEQQAAFFNRLLDRVQALPGVKSAGAVTNLPLSPGSRSRSLFTVEGQPPWAPEEGEQHLAETPAASADYFRAMGIPLRSGRYFTEGDREGTPEIVIINDTIARLFFPQEDPVGRRLKFGFSEAPVPWLAIVGVVGDVRQFGLDTEPQRTIYVPYLQRRGLRTMSLVLRTRSDPESLATAVRREVASLDPELPVYNIATMEQRLSTTVAPRRFRTLLLGLFAALALALAAVGIYGVMSYAVSVRTSEIGVRMALGAQASDILKLVVGQGLTVTIMGLALGLAGALVLTRFLAGLLYGVKATDPPTFIGVSLFLAAVALTACYIPARRATRVDPVAALRHE